MFEGTELTNAARVFQYDFIYFDALFLAGWIFWLIYTKRFSALKAGIVFGLLTYFIDAIVWWNTPAGPDYPVGTFVREYWIGGAQVPHLFGDLFLLKCGADFYMTISYGLFAFTWVWLLFDFWKGQFSRKNLMISTAYWGITWVLTPWLSTWISWNEVVVSTVRHMNSQINIWIVNLFLGFLLLVIVTRSEKFGPKESWRKPLDIFLMGMFVSFMMEFPLYISGIRPINGPFIIYETIFLFNQGAPYLWVMSERLFPYLTRRWKARKIQKST